MHRPFKKEDDDWIDMEIFELRDHLLDKIIQDNPKMHEVEILRELEEEREYREWSKEWDKQHA